MYNSLNQKNLSAGQLAFTICGCYDIKMKWLYLCIIFSSQASSIYCTIDSALSQLSNHDRIWFGYIQELLSFIHRSSHVQLLYTYTSTLTSQLWKFILFRRYHEEGITGAIYMQDINITKIYGNIRSSLIDTLKQGTNEYFIYFSTKLFRKKPFFKFMWRLNINKMLSLNITFDNIYLLNLHCSSYLDIFNEKNVGEIFKFCGQNAKVSVFPKFTNVIIKVFLKQHDYPAYSIVGSFSIMDKRLITSTQIPETSKKKDSVHFGVKLEEILLFKNDIVMFYLWIHVYKDHNVVITHMSSDSQKIKLFDGPGFLSTLLSPRGKLYHCSTYQCTAQVLHIWGNFELVLNHSATELGIHASFYNTHTYVSLPNPNCSSSVCILNIKFDHGYKVNVTLQSMVFQGENSAYCKYGGLSLIEFINEEYNENVALCRNDFSNNIKRRFYSVSSSLKMVLYWYEPYSSTSVTLRISNTECDSIHLSPVTYCHECYYFQPLCVRFTNKITKHLSRSILLYTKLHNIVYDLPRSRCFVLQVFDKPDNHSLIKVFQPCSMRISSKLIPKEHSIIHFYVTGSIQPYFTQPVEKDVLEKTKVISYFFRKNRIQDFIAFYGSADLFCFQFPVLPLCLKNIGGSYWMRFFAFGQYHQMQNISVFGSFETLKNVFIFKIRSFVSLNNWFEIIISKNVSTPGTVLSKPQYSTVVLSSLNMKNISILSNRRGNVIIKPDTPINVYTRFCLNTAKSKFSLVSPVADW